jgi:hypothetical protein
LDLVNRPGFLQKKSRRVIYTAPREICLDFQLHIQKHRRVALLRGKVCINTLFQYLLPLRPGSSVGIESGYGLDGPGIESSVGGEIFRTRPDRP